MAEINGSGLHTNFKLSSLGDNVIFSDGLNVFDQLTIGAQTQNISYSKISNISVFFFD